MIFSPDGKLVASGGRGLRLWNLETGEEVESFDIDVYSLAFSPDGSCIAAGCGRLPFTTSGRDGRNCNYNIRVINLQLAKIPYFYDDGFKPVPWLGLGWGLKLLRGEVRPSPFEGHVYSVYAVAYSADGKKIASSAGDETVQVWDVSTGERTFNANPDRLIYPDASAFSPDITKLVMGTTLFNLSTGSRTFFGLRRMVHSNAFSADGRFFALGSFGGTFKILDTSTHQTIAQLVGHAGDVSFIDFFPDGKRMMSASEDGTIRVWDIDSALLEEGAWEEMDDWQIDGLEFGPRVWIVGSEEEFIFFNPLPFRHVRNTLVIGKCMTIDFSNFVHG